MPAIKHNGKLYPIPTGGEPQATLDSLKAVLPELANATLGKPDKNGDYTIKENFGTKG